MRITLKTHYQFRINKRLWLAGLANYIMFVHNFAYFAFLAAKTRKTFTNSARALPSTQFQILLGGHHDSLC